MDFEYQGKPVHLSRARADLARCDLIYGVEFQSLLKRDAVTRVVQLCATPQDLEQPPIP